MTTSPNRMLGIVLGVIFFVIGIFGFFYTSDIGFAATQGARFIGFIGVNPLLNLVHIAIGILLGVTGLASARAAKGVNTVMGVLFAIFAIYGLFVSSGDNPANVFALNWSEDLLNFIAAVLLLVVGIGAERAPKAVKAA